MIRFGELIGETPWGGKDLATDRSTCIRRSKLNALPDVSVVFVNWNARAFLAGCLQSIFSGAGGLAVEVLVVDNASYDGSVEMVKERFAGVRIISNGKNRGFAKANNQAMVHSNGRYILLLNPDTVVFPGAFQTLVVFVEANPTVGAVGPRMFGAGGETLESFSHFPGLRLLLRGLSIVVSGTYYRKHYPLWARIFFRATVLSIAALSLLPWAPLALVPSKRGKARQIVRADAPALGLIHREEDPEPPAGEGAVPLHNIPTLHNLGILNQSAESRAGELG